MDTADVTTWGSSILVWAQVIAALAVGIATAFLAKYTLQLVRFEKRKRRRDELTHLLSVAEKLQARGAQAFASDLVNRVLPLESAILLRGFSAYKAYLDEYDTECYKLVDELLRFVDTVERDGSIGDNEHVVLYKFTTLKDRLAGFVIHKVRAELGTMKVGRTEI